MIRPLRHRHRVMLVILALTMPVLFAAGLLARRAMPDIVLPPALAAPAFDPGEVLARQLKNTGNGLSLSISTLRPAAGSDRRRIAVHLMSDPKRPEMLVYWSARSAAATAIGDDSYLLGSLIGDEPVLYPLPDAAAAAPGRLIFYSLAQQEVVDSVVLRGPDEAGDRP